MNRASEERILAVMRDQGAETLDLLREQGKELAERQQESARQIDRLTNTMQLAVKGLESLGDTVRAQGLKSYSSNGNGNGAGLREWDWKMITTAGAVLAFVFTLLGSQLTGLDSRLSGGVKEARIDLNDLEERVTSIGSSVRALEKSDEEIEAQFCAQSIIENMRQGYVEALMAVVWPKDGPPMPKIDYWPHIGRRCVGSSQ